MSCRRREKNRPAAKKRDKSKRQNSGAKSIFDARQKNRDKSKRQNSGANPFAMRGKKKII
jgi:hypothetical protein